MSQSMTMRIPSFVGALLIAVVLSSPLFAQTGIPGYGQRLPLGNVGSLSEDWHPGKFERRTGRWLAETSRNIKWVMPLGSQTYGSPIVAGGKVFVGTNNGAGYLERFPNKVDLGCLLCFREEDGKFLWQFSAEKLITGRVNDWPLMGIQSSPWVEGNRAWFVSNRGEVICLDTEGFADKEDDGEAFEESYFHHSIRDYQQDEPIVSLLDKGKLDAKTQRRFAERLQWKEKDLRVEVVAPGKAWRIVNQADPTAPGFAATRDDRDVRFVRAKSKPGPDEADVVWRLDMMKTLGVRPHNSSPCAPTVWKNTLFVCTGNGVDDSHVNIPAPDAPSFIALDKSTGKVLWTSNLPGKNIHHGNWSSPVVGVLGGVPQVIFNGGDGWTYGFHAEKWNDGKPELLWKFDTNPKTAELILGGRGTRNEPIGSPVLHDDRVYLTIGQDPEHGDGEACLWCIDPTKRGDISAELAVMASDPTKIIPYDRIQAVQPKKGQAAIPNPNSAVVWKYIGLDLNNDGKADFEEAMHRTLGPVAISGELLFCSDYSGVVHCLDARSGRPHWAYDQLAACWTPPFIADGKVYCCDEDGDVSIFYPFPNPNAAAGRELKSEKPGLVPKIEPAREMKMVSSIYTMPTASKGVLFIATKDHLFAIQGPKP